MFHSNFLENWNLWDFYEPDSKTLNRIKYISNLNRIDIRKNERFVIHSFQSGLKLDENNKVNSEYEHHLNIKYRFPPLDDKMNLKIRKVWIRSFAVNISTAKMFFFFGILLVNDMQHPSPHLPSSGVYIGWAIGSPPPLLRCIGQRKYPWRNSQLFITSERKKKIHKSKNIPWNANAST